jgi:hypothetical protein
MSAAAIINDSFGAGRPSLWGRAPSYAKNPDHRAPTGDCRPKSRLSSWYSNFPHIGQCNAPFSSEGIVWIASPSQFGNFNSL